MREGRAGIRGKGKGTSGVMLWCKTEAERKDKGWNHKVSPWLGSMGEQTSQQQDLSCAERVSRLEREAFSRRISRGNKTQEKQQRQRHSTHVPIGPLRAEVCFEDEQGSTAVSLSQSVPPAQPLYRAWPRPLSLLLHPPLDRRLQALSRALLETDALPWNPALSVEHALTWPLSRYTGLRGQDCVSRTE